MKNYLVIVFLLIAWPSFGQHELGIRGAGGISYFTTRFTNPLNFEQEFFIEPTIQGGLFYTYHFANKLHVGTELNWMYVEGREKMIVANTDVNGNPNGLFTTVNTYREISAIGIPLYIGYSQNKWRFNIGGEVMVPLHSFSSENTYGVDQNNQAFEWNHDGGELNLDPINFGFRTGVQYDLDELFALEANYTGTINNLLNSAQLSPSWKWEILSLTVGLRFRIITPTKE